MPPLTLASEGPEAPPRRNGELVFEAPWESRAFGIAVALSERGLYGWDEFRGYLIQSIADWEAAHPAGADYRYWDCWQRALERLLQDRGICATRDVDRRSHDYAQRPHGHDH